MGANTVIEKMPTIILNVNDLESALIQHIAQDQAGATVIDLQQPWGGGNESDMTELLRERRDELAETVLLIEAPYANLERTLNVMGKQVVVIDHHLYHTHNNETLDLRSDLSSLDQVLLFLGIDPLTQPGSAQLPPCLGLVTDSGGEIDLDALAHLVSANDRGHIPLLAHHINELDESGKLPPGVDQCELLWDLRLNEMTLTHTMAIDGGIAELADPKVFADKKQALENLFNQAMDYWTRIGKEARFAILALAVTNAMTLVCGS